MTVGSKMQRQSKRGLDDATAARLYQNHAPSILAHLRMHLQSWEEAEDVLVEVFLAAIERENFSQLRETEQRSWLWRVARNKVVDRYRAAQRQQALPLDEVVETAYEDDEHSPEQMTLRQEELMQLRKTIQHLSPQQQQLLQLRFVHEMRCGDIATLMGKSEPAVRMLLSRTLTILRSIYEKH
jgi:RNA polymerase sigma factor (sigma-70 family)